MRELRLHAEYCHKTGDVVIWKTETGLGQARWEIRGPTLDDISTGDLLSQRYGNGWDDIYISSNDDVLQWALQGKLDEVMR